jgi:hypothetical protein
MSIERPLSPVLVFLLACAVPAAALAAQTQPAPKPAATDTAPSDATGKPPLITRNPDGTITVQKEPAPGKTENAAPKGLVIPPQVVVPTASAPANKQDNQGR